MHRNLPLEVPVLLVRTLAVCSSRRPRGGSLALLLCGAALLLPAIVRAGGPKFVAGASYFDPAVVGHPVRWQGGEVGYYVDQGSLNSGLSNQQATAMVDAAAALWSTVPTAEDVNGSDIMASSSGQIVAPADVTSAATNYPVAVIYDADGAVIDALFGATTSAPSACQNNGVFVWADNITPQATFAHAVILLNGLCATTPRLIQMMNFELERAFGRLLGLDYAQVNPGAARNGDQQAMLGWPVMQPLSGVCGASGGACIPQPFSLRMDDMAALSRLYPVTSDTLAGFPGKQITAASTISIQGTVRFANGYGMQGVNVVARPLDAGGNPLDQYAVSAVSGVLFNGKHGSPVSGWTDASGVPLTKWGSNDPALQGAFDLSAIPLPPGMTTADYEVTFEPIAPMDILQNAVGPYSDGQVIPSGTLRPVILHGLAAGSAQTLAVTAEDSARSGFNDAIGVETDPRPMPASGFWSGRLGQVGQTDWFIFPVAGNSLFTVVTQALDESGAPTNGKAMPALAVWDAFNPAGSTAVGAAPGLNGLATGETWLRVATNGADVVRLGIADMRGDGRPDYAYNGWVLYAGDVQPARLPSSGGPIVIHGMGFRMTDTVLVAGQPAVVTSISPNEITAIAPPAAAGVSGAVDVEVDDAPILYAAAIVGGGVSYDAGGGDSLTLVTAPANTVPIGVPLPFTVTALSGDRQPAGGITVTYRVTSGTAVLGCGTQLCPAISSGDGHASMNVLAVDGTPSIVAAALSNGSSLEAHFSGGPPPQLAALTAQLSLAAAATLDWTVQALVLANGVPAPGQTVTWQSPGSGVVAKGATTAVTNASGIATLTLTVGPLQRGQRATISACLNGTSQCVNFSALGARPEYAWLQAVSGAVQTLAPAATPAQFVLRLLDMNGNPMAGGAVELYQSLYAWTPPCAAHAVCPGGALLETQSAGAVSAVDGSVSFAPLALPGVSTRLAGLAISGNTATVSVAVEQR
jgi:IPT/TIG domain